MVSVLSLRIDSWLWRTRFYKSRGQAATAVKSGRVHLNGARVKSSRLVQVTDVLQIAHPRGNYRLTVIGIPLRRGPIAEAEVCYRLDEFEAIGRRKSERTGEIAHPGAMAKRPDKKDRRRLRAMKGKF